jgi:hypothetical protein
MVLKCDACKEKKRRCPLHTRHITYIFEFVDPVIGSSAGAGGLRVDRVVLAVGGLEGV